MSRGKLRLLHLPAEADLRAEAAFAGAVSPPAGEELDLRALRVSGLEAESADAFRRALSACGGAVLGTSADGGSLLACATVAELRRLVPWLLGSSPDLVELAEELRETLGRLPPSGGGPRSLGLVGREGELREPALMGILNVTPDSFSDGALYADTEQAVARAWRIAEEGGHLLDVGGESTRPGSQPVDAEEEVRRVLPVLEALGADYPLPVSVDTSRASVAARAVEAGARVLNDVSALRRDPELARVAAANDTVLVLMHSRGTPETMQSMAVYDDLLGEVAEELLRSVDAALSSGVRPERIWLDPGIGFAKTAEQNLELLRRLPELCALGFPAVVGTSRKRFIGRVTGVEDPQDRLEGTLASCVLALQAGASILRVHDVRAASRATAVAWAVLGR